MKAGPDFICKEEDGNQLVEQTISVEWHAKPEGPNMHYALSFMMHLLGLGESLPEH